MTTEMTTTNATLHQHWEVGRTQEQYNRDRSTYEKYHQGYEVALLYHLMSWEVEKPM